MDRRAQLQHFRSRRERLPGERHSALWGVASCYDLYLYAVAPRCWVVGDGILARDRDQQIAAALAGQQFPSRRAALQAVRAIERLLDER